jgi:WD40-like Beta Propeller Repeat
MSSVAPRTWAQVLLGLALWLGAGAVLASGAQPLLLRHPTLSRSEIAFIFAGDLWSVPHAGGKAKRLTTGQGEKTDPVFSPDGKWIAFTGDYGGNQDVYVIGHVLLFPELEREKNNRLFGRDRLADSSTRDPFKAADSILPGRGAVRGRTLLELTQNQREQASARRP